MRTGTKAGIIGGITAAVLLVVIVPTAVVLSNNKSQQLEIWIPWTEGGVQANAMNDVVKSYNANNGDHLDVKMKYVSGYGAAGESFKLDIDAGSKGVEKLPDMYVDYDGALAILSGYDSKGGNYALDLSQGENALQQDWFVDSLLTSGDQIENANKDGLYGLPIAKSSEMLSINAPAFVLMLNDFINAGGTVDATGTIMNQVFDAAGGAQDGLVATSKYNPDTYAYDVTDGIFNKPKTISDTLYNSNYDNTTTSYSAFSGKVADAAKTVSTKDKKAFKDNWETNGADMKDQTITIDDNTFKSYESLFELGTQLMGIYDLTKDGSYYSHAFIGIDATSNYMAMGITSAGGQLSSINSGGEFVYDAIEDATSEGAAKTAYTVAVDGINSGSALIKGTSSSEPQYTNSLLTAHKAAMVVGSTAGATHDYDYDTNKDGSAKYDGAARGEVVMLSAPTELQAGDADININQGPNLAAIDRSSNTLNSKDKEYYQERENETRAFLTWLTNDGKMDDGTGSETTPAEYLSNKSGYIVGTKSVMDGGNFTSTITNSGTEDISDELMNAGHWEDGVYHQNINKYKIGPAIAYQNFKGDTQKEAYGINSDAFRNKMPEYLKTARDNAVAGKTADTNGADDWLTDVKKDAANDGWISGTRSNSEINAVIANYKI